MSYWKSKVLPKIKKYLPGKKKAAAGEALKSFEASKESIEKELEEKKEELQPKVVEVYKPLDAETKSIVKKPSDEAIKKHAQSVNKLLEELAKIGFPGAAQASEAAGKYGPTLVVGPVIYVFEKASAFITDDVEEEASPAEEAAPSTDVKTETESAPPGEPETSVTTVAEETKTGEGAVVEKVIENTADEGKTVEVTESVTVPQPEPPKP